MFFVNSLCSYCDSENKSVLSCALGNSIDVGHLQARLRGCPSTALIALRDMVEHLYLISKLKIEWVLLTLVSVDKRTTVLFNIVASYIPNYVEILSSWRPGLM